MGPQLIRNSFAQESLRIAAVVNDEIISIYDLESRIQIIMMLSNLASTDANFQSLALPTLRKLIDEKIKLQEASRLGLKVGQEELEKAIDVVEKRHGIAKGNLITLLEKYGADIESLINQLRAEIVWSRIIASKYRGYIVISDDDVNRILNEENKSKDQLRYNISEIVLFSESIEQTKETEEEIVKIVEQLRAGADFNEIARSFSQSPSALNGGEVGWISIEKLPKDLMGVVSNLKAGEVSQPIKINTSLVLIKLNDIRVQSDQDLLDPILKLSQFHLALEPNISEEQIINHSIMATQKTKTLNGCKALDDAGKQFGSSMSGSLGEIRLSQLPANLKEIVRDLPVGQSSSPIKSQESIIVLMVCDRLLPPIQNKNITRDMAKNRLFAEKISVYARKELRELRRSAYIEIR